MFSREVGKQHSRFFMISLGLAGLFAAAVTFYIGYQAASTVPGRGYYNLHAEFANAENLANHYEIRQGGVRVGQILKPRVKDGKALIDLRIDDKYKPLRADTQLRIRLRSAVGVRYLEIIPGTKGAPLPEGATIPTSNTATPVALDKVLGTFDRDTRARMRDLMNEMGAGTMSRGRDVNEAIAAAPKFLSGLGAVSRAINDRPGALSAFIARGDEAADAFDSVRDDIATGFRPETQALAPFNDRRKDVQATLSAAGPALTQLQRSLPAVRGLVGEVGRFAHDGRPALHEAPPALRSTTRLLSQAGAPLGDLKKTLRLLADSVRPTLRLLGTAKPVLPAIDTTFGDLIPTLDEAAPRACDITQFATGWAEYLKYGDEYANNVRFLIVGARPEQPAGQTANIKKLPTADGRDAYDGLINKRPYHDPCVNGVGAAGFEQPTVDESLRGETYSATNLPGNG